MSTNRKQKKQKQKTVSLQEFTASLEPSLPVAGQNIVYAPKKAMTTSWAEDCEEFDRITEKERIILPSAPRAARGPPYEDSQIPRLPPYKAHLGNISYDIDDEDVCHFFNGLKVDELRLPRDDNNRLRGFGYVEFRSREDLIEALIMNEQMLRGRPIRISLGTSHGDEGGRMGGRRQLHDATPSDWRAPVTGYESDCRKCHAGPDFYPGGQDFSNGRRNDFSGRPITGYYNRRMDFGRQTNEMNGSRMRSAYDRPPYVNYPGDFYGGHGDVLTPQPTRTAPSRRPEYDYSQRLQLRGVCGSGSFYEHDRDRGDYHQRSHSRDDHDDVVFDWRRDSGTPILEQRHGLPGDMSECYKESIGFGKRAMRMEEEDTKKLEPAQRTQSSGSPPRERKKLILQPRSKTLSDSNNAPTCNPAIFGEAKPVDTAAREREIEKKLQEMNLLETKKLRSLRPKPEACPPMDFVQKKQDTSQRFRKDSSGSSSRSVPPPLMGEPSSPPRLFTRRDDLRRRRSDEIERDKDTNSEPEDDRDLRFIDFHHGRNGGGVDRKNYHVDGIPEGWRGSRMGNNNNIPRARNGDGPRIN